MKTIIIAILIYTAQSLIQTPFISAQLNLSDYNLEGEVKYIRVITYDAEFESGTYRKEMIAENLDFIAHGRHVWPSNVSNFHLLFSKEGKLTEVCEYVTDGFPYSIFTLKYDSLNRLKEKNLFDKYGSLMYKYNYIYDSEGMVTCKTDKYDYSVSYKDNSLYSRDFFFKFRNHKLDLNPIDKTLKEECKYDKSGNIVLRKAFDFEGIPKYECRYEYDKSNNKISELVAIFFPNHIVEYNIMYY